jgi:steroid delta-isomerase-like uncharacterized protein
MNTHHALVERYLAAWTAGDLDAFDDLLTPDYQNHSSSLPDSQPGPAGLKPIVAAMRRGIPDLAYELVHVLAVGDLVAFHTLVRGTQTGELFGSAPTGRAFCVRQMQVERIRDGRIAEHWRVTDEAGMARQLQESGYTVPTDGWNSEPTPTSSPARSPTRNGWRR